MGRMIRFRRTTESAKQGVGGGRSRGRQGGGKFVGNLYADSGLLFATLEHLRAISGAVNAEQSKALRLGAAESVKRVRLWKAEEAVDWEADGMEGLKEIRALVECKTTWHPVGGEFGIAECGLARRGAEGVTTNMGRSFTEKGGEPSLGWAGWRCVKWLQTDPGCPLRIVQQPLSLRLRAMITMYGSRRWFWND